MAFPTSPSNNQVHKEGARTWVYDSSLGTWDQIRQQAARQDIQTTTFGHIGNQVRMPAGTVAGYKRYLYGFVKKQVASDSHVVIIGSSHSYTPPAGARFVYYQTRFTMMGNLSSNHKIAHFKIRLNNADLNHTMEYRDNREGTSGHFSWGYVNKWCCVDAWSGAQTIQTTFRRYSSQYGFWLNNRYLWDGQNPHYNDSNETIIYSIM